MRTFFLSVFFLIVIKSNGQYANGHPPSNDKNAVHKRHTYPTPPRTNNSLFYIQRSNNASAIVYDGNRDQYGNLDKENPVHVYWLSYSQDSTMNELNYIQRKLAYGVHISETSKKDEFDISLVSYKRKKIRIFKNQEGEMQANMMISGEMARFRNVYVEITKNLFIPEIAYVEVFGEDLITGKEVYEKIIP
ncbi:MAG: DUF4833 domain-containing protein [Cyclobacteriaceae bacterium]